MDELTSKQKELERYKRYRDSHKEERKKRWHDLTLKDISLS